VPAVRVIRANDSSTCASVSDGSAGALPGEAASSKAGPIPALPWRSRPAR
jgi:hypothetical protein